MSAQTATSVLSWDSPHRRIGHVEVVGSEATLSIPDPNHFDGHLRIRAKDDDEWRRIPATGPVGGRGLGVLDIARAVRAGVPHRASGELAYHVVDVLATVTESIERREPVPVSSTTGMTRCGWIWWPGINASPNISPSIRRAACRRSSPIAAY